MKILVAGAGGYIGIPLSQRLALEGHQVVALDRYFFGREPTGCTIWKDDTRFITAHDVKDTGAEAVVDLAGLSNDASCEIDQRYTRQINEVGGKNLFDCSVQAGVRRYVYSSSASVYGAGAHKSLCEHDQTSPLTAYARSKLAVERHFMTVRDDIETVILRNATVFGFASRMRFDLAVNAMTRRAVKDRNIYVMGGGEQWRPFIHVRDVVDAFVWALGAPADYVSGHIYNIGFDNQQMTIETLAGLVSQCVPGAWVHWIPDNIDDRNYHLSFKKYNDARPGLKPIGVVFGITEIADMIRSGKIDADDPTTMTVAWYKSMLEWGERLKGLTMNNGILL